MSVLTQPQSGSHLLVNGMGGVGKTAICRVLALQCAKQVNALIWLDCQAGITDGLQNKVAPELDIDIKHPDWQRLLLAKLNQIEPPAVLFLDNIEPSQSNTKILQALKHLNWHLVATSRYPLAEFTYRHEIDVLPLPQCVDLFLQYYKTPVNPEDQACLESLIKLAGKHTLTVELLAKIASDSVLSVQTIFEQVTEKGFDLRHLTEVTVESQHSGTETGEHRQHELHVHLSKLFQLARLAKDEQTILRLLAILPHQAYDCNNELMVWLGLDKPQHLINLSQKGWLQRTGQHFSIHPVVADVAKNQITLDLDAFEQFANRFNEAIMPGEMGHWIHQSGYAAHLLALIGAFEEEDDVTAGLLSNLARILKAKGQYNDVLPLYERGLAIKEKIHDSDHPHVATSRNNLAGAYESLGLYDKAVELYQLALASDLKTYGEDHPEVAISRNNLGLAYQSLGKYDKAVELLQLALASGVKTYGEDHPKVAIRRNNLGLAYKSQGQYDKAVELYQLALASNLKTYGEEHPEVARCRNNLGLTYKSLGQYDKAVELFQLALASDLKTYGKGHPEVATKLNNLAGGYESLRQYDKAVELYQLALDSLEKVFDPQHPHVKGAKANLEYTKAKRLSSFVPSLTFNKT